MHVGTAQTEFAATTQGLTGEGRTTRCLAQLKLCAAKLPDDYKVQSLDAKDDFLKALTSMDLVHPDPQKINPFSLYKVSESFHGTSAAQGPILITRSADSLLKAVKGLLATDACAFGLEAVATRYLKLWRVFLETRGTRLTEIRDGRPESLRIFEHLHFEINAEHDDIVEECRTGMPTTLCLYRA